MIRDDKNGTTRHIIVHDVQEKIQTYLNKVIIVIGLESHIVGNLGSISNLVVIVHALGVVTVPAYAAR
tara:strand:- start:207 stop:410 length:204 start_codon:yes stop_codon:yes gene_type:complete